MSLNIYVGYGHMARKKVGLYSFLFNWKPSDFQHQSVCLYPKLCLCVRVCMVCMSFLVSVVVCLILIEQFSLILLKTVY